ncbi:MBL fold metallo-hydrolase [Salinisphaera sp. Q1T1-3]|uniref:MBL fold metallo-hydrolase n=1 Tax=Salinisphaera sp. Q1T1-3 TaxID=2321229 RepID=UPI0013143948|nr:MBL fold metallo-hydrolase [Salinisphaera sp. Q1T1-3]
MHDTSVMTRGPVRIAPGVTRLVAPNPSPMTGPGTNTYILGHGPYLVVDPAVDDEAHLQAIGAVTQMQIEAIVLTHRHPDHAGGAEALAAASGASILAWPKPRPGAHDQHVIVDRSLRADERLVCGGLTIRIHHAPGHAADCIALEVPDAGLLLAGDTLMTDVTVVILPPDGDMTAYFETLARLRDCDIQRIAPGHGDLIETPRAEIARVIAHREARESQVAAALAETTVCAPEDIVDGLYPALDSRLRPMAAQQIEAHLRRLGELGRARRLAHGWQAIQDASSPRARG